MLEPLFDCLQVFPVTDEILLRQRGEGVVALYVFFMIQPGTLV